MKHQGVQFEFGGFDPEYEIKKIIKSVAEDLEFSAPSDSLVKMAFFKGVGAIRASCRIFSQAGTFVADTVSENPVRAVKQLEEKIRRQLDEWKRQRFCEGV